MTADHTRDQPAGVQVNVIQGNGCQAHCSHTLYIYIQAGAGLGWDSITAINFQTSPESLLDREGFAKEQLNVHVRLLCH